MNACDAAQSPVTSTALGPRIGDYRAPIVERKLRVVYVWDADYPWDVRAEKISATLTSAGHDVHIVARNRAWRQCEEELPEGTVHRMRPWRWAGRRLDDTLGFPAFFSPRWTTLLSRTVRQVGADVIVGRDIPLAATSVWVAKRHGIPVVLDVAENYPAMMQMIFDTGRQRPLDYVVRNPAAVASVERYSLTRADRILVVIEEMADRLVRMGVHPHRIDIVSNTPPRERAERSRPSTESDPSAPVSLVYLGLLEVARGLSELVDAVALLRDRLPVRLTVIGAGRDRSVFVERAAAHGLGPSEVQFLGYVERDRALEIVGTADIGLLPHHANEMWNTTIPNKLFDYMASGLPVVTSSAIPCARIVRETGAGEVFQAGDAHSLAEAIMRLSDAERRRACGSAGRRAIAEQYNWEHDTPILLRSVESAVLTKQRRDSR